MAFSRYRNSARLGLNSQYGTFRAIAALRKAVDLGIVPIKETITLTGNQRLDHIAAIHYGDSRFWWILAGASEIGWGLQLPPGTVINIPDFDSVVSFIG